MRKSWPRDPARPAWSRVVRDDGEPGAGHASLGGAKAGVEGEGFLPVAAGLAGLASG